MTESERKEFIELLQKRIDLLTVMITEYNKLLLSYVTSRNKLQNELSITEKELERLKSE
jgi:hypothetical protein